MRFFLTALFLTFGIVIFPAQLKYDLLLKNGHVIDPKNGINETRDLAIAKGLVAAVEKSIDPSTASKVIDLSGLYVTPGLVDIHVHGYVGTGLKAYAGDWSVYPDLYSFRSCTTTMVDAGTSGRVTFEDFKQRIIDRSLTRIFVMLNIVGLGMIGGPAEQDVNDMDAQKTAEMIKKYPDLIVGVKTAHYARPDWAAVDRAVEAGRLANVPVMVDFGEFRTERPHSELILKKLRPGDIYTHAYIYRVPMLDESGKLRPYLLEGQKRGVFFDVGHGAGSFSFRQAVPALKQGFAPDSISTDLHLRSAIGTLKDLNNLMSKFLNMGMPLEDVILRTTWNPAREIKREKFGHLSVGAPADVAVLRIERGDFGFLDSDNKVMKGNQRVACEMTFMDGEVMYDLNGRTSEPWEKPARSN